MAVVLTNLSDSRFAESRRRQNASAECRGIDQIRSYDWDQLLDTDFYRENRIILDQPTGLGFWLWKPYIILEALHNASDGDIVIYADSGLEIIASLEPLYHLCHNENPIILFGNGDLSNSMWTKRDCFILMDCDGEGYWKAPQCDAAFCLFQKCETSLRFVTEWLGYCRDARILTDSRNSFGRHNLPDFIEHRRDQSVLSLLACKYRLPLFRMPTQFGNHYKMHPYRINGEFNCVSQYRQQRISYYATIPYYNSPYFQLLNHHRSNVATAVRTRGLFYPVFRAVKKRWRRWNDSRALRRERKERGGAF